MPKSTARTPGPLDSGHTILDAFAVEENPTLQDYVNAVSDYVLTAGTMTPSVRKRSQIALSGGLGRSVRQELVTRVPTMAPHAGERNVAGALRSARADVSESHELDGLRLAIEIKPINLAIGRAIWNRFGDVRAFAVNIHLKFPFAVVGGLLAVPTWEWKQSASGSSELSHETPPSACATGDAEVMDDLVDVVGAAPARVSTRHLIQRAERRFVHARFREIESDPAHLLEATGLVVYDPETSTIDPDLPSQGSGLRWDEFLDRLANVYALRFDS